MDFHLLFFFFFPSNLAKQLIITINSNWICSLSRNIYIYIYIYFFFFFCRQRCKLEPNLWGIMLGLVLRLEYVGRSFIWAMFGGLWAIVLGLLQWYIDEITLNIYPFRLFRVEIAWTNEILTFEISLIVGKNTC